MIIWLYGNAGSGKTTLAKELLEDKDFNQFGQWVHIDGDHIRAVFDNQDYSREGRLKNGQLAINLCKILNDQAVNIVVSLITPYAQTRNEIRKKFPEALLVELFYNTSTQKRREPHMLASDYEKALFEDNWFAINTGNMTIDGAFNEIKVKAIKR